MDEKARRTLAECGRDISLSYLRSAGPGGQNVNKVATAVQLRFDLRHSTCMDVAARRRFVRIAGNRVSGKGLLTIEGRRFRTQVQNRKDVLLRFRRMLLQALEEPKSRRPTHRTASSKQKRLDDKRRRSELKRLRRLGHPD